MPHRLWNCSSPAPALICCYKSRLGAVGGPELIPNGRAHTTGNALLHVVHSASIRHEATRPARLPHDLAGSRCTPTSVSTAV